MGRPSLDPGTQGVAALWPAFSHGAPPLREARLRPHSPAPRDGGPGQPGSAHRLGRQAAVARSWRTHVGRGSRSLDTGAAAHPGPHVGAAPSPRVTREARLPQLASRPGLKRLITVCIISAKLGRLHPYLSPPGLLSSTRPDPCPPPLQRPATLARGACPLAAGHAPWGRLTHCPSSCSGQQGTHHWGLDQAPILVRPVTCSRSSHQGPRLHPGQKCLGWSRLGWRGCLAS